MLQVWNVQTIGVEEYCGSLFKGNMLFLLIKCRLTSIPLKVHLFSIY